MQARSGIKTQMTEHKTRAQAVAAAARYFDDGGFVSDLGRRVAIPTESQNPARRPDLKSYLTAEMTPTLERMGFTCRILPNPVATGGPFLLAERIEDPKLVTLFSYGHGDVIRGQEPQWRDGLSPWLVKPEGERLYGRGTADNKGQHTINIGALASVLQTRGKLNFNIKLLIETGEEVGSPGLREVSEQNRALFKADVFVASDGPRLSPERPTIFLGSRGAMNFDLTVDLREGGHHSGNWGGLACQSGNHPCACASDHHLADRPDPGQGLAAHADPRIRCATRSPIASSRPAPPRPRSIPNGASPA